MAEIIYNTSFVTDFSVDPPASFGSNPVQTEVIAAPAARVSIPYCRREENCPQPRCCLCRMLGCILQCFFR